MSSNFNHARRGQMFSVIILSITKMNKFNVLVECTHIHRRLYSIATKLGDHLTWYSEVYIIPNASICTYPAILSSELERESTSWVNDGRCSDSTDQHWCMNEYLNSCILYCNSKHFVTCVCLCKYWKLRLVTISLIEHADVVKRWLKVKRRK